MLSEGLSRILVNHSDINELSKVSINKMLNARHSENTEQLLKAKESVKPTKLRDRSICPHLGMTSVKLRNYEKIPEKSRIMAVQHYNKDSKSREENAGQLPFHQLAARISDPSCSNKTILPSQQQRICYPVSKRPSIPTNPLYRSRDCMDNTNKCKVVLPHISNDPSFKESAKKKLVKFRHLVRKSIRRQSVLSLNRNVKLTRSLTENSFGLRIARCHRGFIVTYASNYVTSKGISVGEKITAVNKIPCGELTLEELKNLITYEKTLNLTISNQ